MGMRIAHVSGHFGEFLQGRLGGDGPVILVTLPCRALGVTARFAPASGLRIHGAGQRLLTPERARKFLHGLGIPARGRFTLRATMPAGGGAGASTAALIALARAAGHAGVADRLARAAIAAEGASDPLMHPSPERLLWASRQGRSLRALPPIPRFDVLGGFAGPPRRTDARDLRFPDVADLVAAWEEAARAGDRTTLARLAAEAADRTLALRGGANPALAELAAATGALGYAIAHTGSARALLFAPGGIPAHAAALMRGAGCRQVIRFRTGGQP